MTKQEIVEEIQTQLGDWGVEVEITPEAISKLIDKALDKIEPYINDTEYMEVEANEEVDLSGEGIIDVVKVYNNRPTTSNYENINLFRVRNYADFDNFMDRINMPYRRSQLEDFIDRGFKYDVKEEKLYFDDYYGNVTIEVIKEADVESLQEKSDLNWVRDYALALVKESLGRVRGKYNVQDAPYEIEGRDLVQEGTQEKKELEQKLEEKGFHYITR